MKDNIIEQDYISVTNNPSPLTKKQFIQFKKELKEFILDFIVKKCESYSPNSYDPYLCHICINYKNCDKIKLMEDQNSYVYLVDLHRMAAKLENTCFFPNIITQKSIPVLIMSKYLNSGDYKLLRKLIQMDEFPIYKSYVQLPNVVNEEDIIYDEIKSFLLENIGVIVINIFLIICTIIVLLIAALSYMYC